MLYHTNSINSHTSQVLIQTNMSIKLCLVETPYILNSTEMVHNSGYTFPWEFNYLAMEL